MILHRDRRGSKLHDIAVENEWSSLVFDVVGIGSSSREDSSVNLVFNNYAADEFASDFSDNDVTGSVLRNFCDRSFRFSISLLPEK